MVAADVNGNKTPRDITITAYVPTPSITAASPAMANGSLDVRVAGEPVDIFRYRGGQLSRLSGSGETVTDASGNFARAFTGSEGVVLTHSGKTIADIDEKTGKIEVKDSDYSISVRPAEANNPMVVAVRDKNGAEVYSQSFALPETTKIENVGQLSNVKDSGVFVQTESDVGFVRNASDAKSIPGGAFLIGEDHKPFAGIGKDGNVYLLEKGYSLSYRSQSGYPLIVMKNRTGSVVAEIFYRIEAEYVIK